VAELFYKIDERVHLKDGHVNTIVVGGIGPDGRDAVTPLTYMLIDVFDRLNLTHPALYTRISKVNPPEYVDRCVSYLLSGGNRAQILADEPILRAMTRDERLPFRDAAMYVCGGCMELSPHGMNSDLLFSFVYNVPKMLELVLTGGVCLVTGQQRLPMRRSLSNFDTFEDLYSVFENEMRRTLHTKFRCLDVYSQEMARCRPKFLQSSMIADCLERGRCQQDGGARYGDYGAAPVGIQNAADSLYAVKRAVYDEGFCSAEELVVALKADFQGHDALHARLRAIPKYGVGDLGADAMMDRVLTSVCGIFDAYINRHGRYVKPMVFTFVWAPEMGMSLGASADGRRAGQPIAHGLTPQAGGLVEGITASIGSYASLSGYLVAGGATTMWDMDPSWIDHPLLGSILRAFIGQGGQIFQGNMTSVKELWQAYEDPESYPNLIVRVGGFSARFVHLDRALQKEILERYRHAR
jgi:formate C-acetyltransferase